MYLMKVIPQTRRAH